MLFANYITLINETRQDVNNKLEWKDTIRTIGFLLSRSKTECSKCRFNEGESSMEDEVAIGGVAIVRVESLDI